MRRRILVTLMSALAVLMPFFEASTASAARHRHAPTKSCPTTRQLIAADSQAEVYFARGTYNEEVLVRGCAYKTRRSFTLYLCSREHGIEESRADCSRTIRLVNADVAFELGSSFVVVRNLGTGRTLHKIPTGTPLRPTPEYLGVGDVVALVLKSDGAAAWIAEDDERSTGRGSLHETLYFDVEAVDASGTTQLLAAGTDIDPTSLALASGGSNIGYKGINREGSIVFWTQAGKVFSAPLN